MKRNRYQMLGDDTPLTKEDMIKESEGFKSIELFATWQKNEICHSGYQLKGAGKKIETLKVLTFSIN